VVLAAIVLAIAALGLNSVDGATVGVAFGLVAVGVVAQVSPANLAHERRHRQLALRYVERLSPDQIARELTLSPRQASRDLQRWRSAGAPRRAIHSSRSSCPVCRCTCCS
jgi:hypothetical protein